jgi:hypothetical protein
MINQAKVNKNTNLNLTTVKWGTNAFKVYYDGKRVKNNNIVKCRVVYPRGRPRDAVPVIPAKYHIDIRGFYPKKNKDIATTISQLLAERNKIDIFRISYDTDDQKMDIISCELKISEDITFYVITFMCTFVDNYGGGYRVVCVEG